MFLGFLNFEKKTRFKINEFSLDDVWICNLPFMTDVFGFFNKFNIFFQGFCTNVNILKNKMDALRKNVVVLGSHIQKKDNS